MDGRNESSRVLAFQDRALKRLAKAERRLLRAKAAACFLGLEFLNGRLLDTTRLDALSSRIQRAEEEYLAAREALTRIEPDAPAHILDLPRSLELFIAEIERLAAIHGLNGSHWPRADLEEMAEELIQHRPA